MRSLQIRMFISPMEPENRMAYIAALRSKGSSPMTRNQEVLSATQFVCEVEGEVVYREFVSIKQRKELWQ